MPEKHIPEIEESTVDVISRLLDTLFDSGSIMRYRFDPQSGYSKENPRFSECQSYEEDIRNYLSVMHIRLKYEPNYDMYYIESDTKCGQMLGQNETILLLLLRYLYEEKMETKGLGPVSTSIEEIRKVGMDTGLITEKIAKSAWRDALRLFKRKNIITFAGSLNDLKDGDPVYILEMIAITVSSYKIQQLLKGEGNEQE